jgi:hypothetical protein
MCLTLSVELPMMNKDAAERIVAQYIRVQLDIVFSYHARGERHDLPDFCGIWSTRQS